MKKIIILAFLIGSAFLVSAQLVLSSGSQIVVNSTSVLVVTDLTTAGGTIKNSGEVTVLGNITNNSGDLFTSDSDGTISFEGSEAQEITGTSSTVFKGTVVINNSTGVALTNTATGAAQSIPGSLTFTSGKLTLNAFTLTLGGTADPTGVGSSAYIVTNGAGQLKRTVASSNILFPVGNSTYNPITLNNAGTSDIYGVIAKDGLPSSFTSNNHAVNRYWDISETSGGSSSLTVKGQWSTNTTPSNEQASFARGYSCIGYTEDNGANISWGSIGAATGGTDDWLWSQSGYTQDLSTARSFFIADDYYKGYNLNLEVWLSGPYNSTNHDMDNDLNTAGGTLLIPTTDPYEGTTTVGSIHVDIVDWVKIELRASNRTTVRKTYHAFVNTSGAVVDYNNDPYFVSEADFSLTDYSVAIIHRNHFGVVSNSNDINLRTSSGTDLTLLANVYDDATVTLPENSLNLLESGVYGLWSGDANGDGMLRYNGTDNDRGVVLGVLSNAGATSSGYADTDLNMDRITRYNGTDNDRGIIIGNLPNAGTTYNQHLPE